MGERGAVCNESLLLPPDGAAWRECAASADGAVFFASEGGKVALCARD